MAGRRYSEKQQIGARKTMSFLIFGFCTACVAAILTNPTLAKTEPREKIVALNSSPNATKLIPAENCHFASYTPHKVTCNLDLKIPLVGSNGLEEVTVGVVAMFDGHIGSDASDMASSVFLDKFLLKNYGAQASNYMEFLKSSLVETIEEIDAEFSKVAVERKLRSGCTAVVALIYNHHVLVASVGDSNAFLCSRNMQSHEAGAASLVGLLAKKLTRDHNAYRLDERARVEASGGRFTPNYVPLLMGYFPMTRAIGDVPLKRYGIIARPEVTDWLNLTSKDEFLVVASGGVFERSSPQEVCNFLSKVKDHSGPTLLAQQLVWRAYARGNSENLAVILVPL